MQSLLILQVSRYCILALLFFVDFSVNFKSIYMNFSSSLKVLRRLPRKFREIGASITQIIPFLPIKAMGYSDHQRRAGSQKFSSYYKVK